LQGNKASNTRKVQTQGTVRNETIPYSKRRQTMPYTQQQTGLSVGIDGSKDTLPIAPYPTEQGWEMPNQPTSWQTLAARLQKQPVQRVLLESSGVMRKAWRTRGSKRACQW
jgi:hypothetical protein